MALFKRNSKIDTVIKDSEQKTEMINCQSANINFDETQDRTEFINNNNQPDRLLKNTEDNEHTEIIKTSEPKSNYVEQDNKTEFICLKDEDVYQCRTGHQNTIACDDVNTGDSKPKSEFKTDFIAQSTPQSEKKTEQRKANKEEYQIEITENITEIPPNNQITKSVNSTTKKSKNTSYILKLVDKENGGKAFERTIDNVLVIGRKRELCDLSINYDRTVSSRQCKIYIKNKKLYIADLGGTNITYLNDKPLHDDALIEDGNVLGFGRLNFRVYIKKTI
jgi:hypothetical protein